MIRASPISGLSEFFVLEEESSALIFFLFISIPEVPLPQYISTHVETVKPHAKMNLKKIKKSRKTLQISSNVFSKICHVLLKMLSFAQSMQC